MSRKVLKQVQGFQTTDGAGVHLTRVLSNRTTQHFDPFLMLDSFDATDPELYIKGFPMHPHRGIETITYLVKGRIEHMDSLGNTGAIESGECQWMTAGSGIMHEEMPMPVERMLGLQLWLNLPADTKMTPPTYFDIKADMIPMHQINGGEVRVISGSFEGTDGVKPPHIQATLLDLDLKEGTKITLPTENEHTAFIFTILGSVKIDDTKVEEKTAALLTNGSSVTIRAIEDTRVFFYTAPRLNESIAWGGPIVMNAGEELTQAFDELRDGTFIKTNVAGK